MYLLYDIAIFAANYSLKILAFFNPKLKLFVRGRKDTFRYLKNKITSADRVLWIHCASLGEFEQGRPLIEAVKTQYPTHKILLTFFSPSGYEVRKDYAVADFVCYLPLDMRSKVQKFLEYTRPEMAIFVKYEFWPNYLRALKNRQIPTVLISGIFRKDQAFFKPYGSWMRRSLQSFDHFFVQNESSKALLNSINFQNVTLSGDTRFDRVFQLLHQNNSISGLDRFVDNSVVLVAGSTWPDDENLLAAYINTKAKSNEKFILAPHVVDSEHIDRLEQLFQVKTYRFSKGVSSELEAAQVLLVDSIGLLTKLYSYATVAYVGGGFKTGLHNVLEPATFGIPVLIGPRYDKFKEAKELVALGACLVISNQDELNHQLELVLKDREKALEIGKISKNYVKNNVGATEAILKYLDKRL